jgi:glucose-fructose oxidoreductase
MDPTPPGCNPGAARHAVRKFPTGCFRGKVESVMAGSKSRNATIRFAVVGTGWFAQDAVLPAFTNAGNAALVAIFSGDAEKRHEIGKRYKARAYGYEQYEEKLKAREFEAVYIALPNSMHKEYTIAAARHGVHVLCEKPLAGTATDCREMIDACERGGSRLMTAYRLHFESANLAAIKHITNGDIGEPRVFHGLNCQTVEAGNTRLDAELKGGPLMDLGIYCINAARYLFRDDPTEVSGFASHPPDPKYREVPEMVTAVMRFPGERLATFTCGFGESKVSEFRVIGTKADIRLMPAFTFRGDISMFFTREGDVKETRFPERDQVGAEIVYFADCIRNGTNPEPDGYEGLADLIIIDAIKESIRAGRAIPLVPFKKKDFPTPAQEFKLPKIEAPKLINAASPSGD